MPNAAASLRLAAALALAIVWPGCMPGPSEYEGTPAGEHAPTGAVARDSLTVRFVEASGEAALSAVVAWRYRVAGDSVVLALPLGPAPADVRLAGRAVAPADTGRAIRLGLLPSPVSADERARLDSLLQVRAGDLWHPATDSIDVATFRMEASGPAGLEVRHPVTTRREETGDQPYARHVVEIAWAPGLEGEPAVRAEAPRPWRTSVRLTDAGLRVTAERPPPSAASAAFRTVWWALVGLGAVVAAGLAGGRAGRSLGTGVAGSETSGGRWGLGMTGGLGLIGLAVGLGIALAAVAWGLAALALASGDDRAYLGSQRLATMTVGVVSGQAAAVAALVAGGVAAVRAGLRTSREDGSEGPPADAGP